MYLITYSWIFGHFPIFLYFSYYFLQNLKPEYYFSKMNLTNTQLYFPKQFSNGIINFWITVHRQNSIRLKEVSSGVMKSIIGEVCEFVMEESEPSVNDIRIVLNRQVQRAELRQRSLTSMLELVELSHQLIPSVKYYLLNGWQGNCIK